MNRQGILNYLRDAALEAVDQPSKALETGAYLKDLEKTVKDLQELLKETLIREAQAYGKEGVTKGGYHITVNSGSRKWKYQGQAIADAEDYLTKLRDAAQLAHRMQKSVIIDGDGIEVEPAIAIFDKESVVFRKERPF